MGPKPKRAAALAPPMSGAWRQEVSSVTDTFWVGVVRLLDLSGFQVGQYPEDCLTYQVFSARRGASDSFGAARHADRFDWELGNAFWQRGASVPALPTPSPQQLAMQQQMQLAAQIHAWMSSGGMTCNQVQAASESLSQMVGCGTAAAESAEALISSPNVLEVHVHCLVSCGRHRTDVTALHFLC